MALRRFLTRIHASCSHHTCSDIFVRCPDLLRAVSNPPLSSLNLESHSLDNRSIWTVLRHLVRTASTIGARGSPDRDHGTGSDHVRSRSTGQNFHFDFHVRINRLDRGQLFLAARVRFQKPGGTDTCSYDAFELLGYAR